MYSRHYVDSACLPRRNLQSVINLTTNCELESLSRAQRESKMRLQKNCILCFYCFNFHIYHGLKHRAAGPILWSLQSGVRAQVWCVWDNFSVIITFDVWLLWPCWENKQPLLGHNNTTHPGEREDTDLSQSLASVLLWVTAEMSWDCKELLMIQRSHLWF